MDGIWHSLDSSINKKERRACAHHQIRITIMAPLVFSVASSFVSFLLVITVALSYGYIEAFCQRGHAVAIIFGLFLIYRCKYFLLPMIFTFAHVLSLSKDYANTLLGSSYHKELQLGSFAALLLISLFLEQREEDDTIVKFRPYEEDIRQFLLEKDPSLLPRVDSLLIKYSGKERQLFQKLKAKYGSGSNSFFSPLKSP